MDPEIISLQQLNLVAEELSYAHWHESLTKLNHSQCKKPSVQLEKDIVDGERVKLIFLQSSCSCSCAFYAFVISNVLIAAVCVRVAYQIRPGSARRRLNLSFACLRFFSRKYLLFCQWPLIDLNDSLVFMYFACNWKRCSGWGGANPGSFGFHLFSLHFEAVP